MKGFHMKSIMTTYPDFQTLPREVKKFLLESEDYFFQQANTHAAAHSTPAHFQSEDHARSRPRQSW
jgi:hypothetical protein